MSQARLARQEIGRADTGHGVASRVKGESRVKK